MRWNPSTFTITEQPLEVVCEYSTTFDELRTLIAKAVQLGDDEFGATDIAHIGVAKRGWRMESVLDVPGLPWDADREDPETMDACLLYSMSLFILSLVLHSVCKETYYAFPVNP
jgi:hypothetical protein